ncbi:MAG: hypothetical protein AAF677_07795 [Pseudomonadota bacterium]
MTNDMDTTTPGSVTDAELNAFCDGELNEDETVRIAAAIEADAALRVRMAQMMGDIAALRAVSEPEGDDAATAALAEKLGQRVQRRTQRRMIGRVGAGVAASMALVAGGWIGHGAYVKSTTAKNGRNTMVMAEVTQGVPSFVADAAGAHEVFAPDTFHPVEFTAKDEAAMARWFSDRLGEAAMIPHLEELGFGLVGGRLLAGSEGPMAQVMYENDRGDRVSLVFGKQQVSGSKELKLVHMGKTYASYWQNNGFSWAVLEESPGADVSMVASHVSRLVDR